jgi:hypothetical protein
MDTLKAEELADDLHKLANLFAIHGADLPSDVNISIYSYLWSWRATEPIPETLATTMRAALKVGAEVNKVYDDDRFRLNIKMPNGQVTYQVSAERDKVCTKRITGTEMIEKDVPPEGEWTKKMVERDVVEWDCHPLLAVTKDD